MLTLDEIKNSNGQILLSIFTQSEGFPYKPDTTIKLVKDTLIMNKQINFKIENLPFGEYAFAICDDENFNHTMNYNRIGLPCEGFGFSNNINPIISPPKYKLCKIKLDTNEINIKINLIYKNAYHEKIQNTDSISIDL